MTMTRDEITRLVDSYRTALERKVAAETQFHDCTTRAEILQARILQAAYENSLIKGKNAATREYEEKVILADHEQYQAVLSEIANAQSVAGELGIRFKVQELRASLTRAWLYAQRPELP